jgi:hypothetical protein
VRRRNFLAVAAAACVGVNFLLKNDESFAQNGSQVPLSIQRGTPEISVGPQMDAIPEFWAREGLAILEESMVVGRIVHRDFT